MRSEEGIIVAIDKSDSSDRTLEYVGHMVAGRRDLKIRLLHLLPPYPREVVEFVSRGSPDQEMRLEREMEQARIEWLTAAGDDAEPLFDHARTIIEGAGVSPESIEEVCCEVTDEAALTRKCIEAAEACGYRTIALGRSSLPWYRELFHKHPSDLLVRNGQGFTIWVVE